MKLAIAILISSVAAILFAAGAAPPLIHGMQAQHQTNNADFGMTMKTMPGADALVQAPDGPPGLTNPSNMKLNGALIGIGLFGLLLSGSLVIRPPASLRSRREVATGVGLADVPIA